jgi:PAS domain S-box-containing protein
MSSQNYLSHKWHQSNSPIEELYAGLFENTADMIFTCDLAGNLTTLNRVGEQITGYKREEVLRKNLLEVVAPEYREAAAYWVERAVKGETLPFALWGIVAKDGCRILLEVSIQLIYQEGKPVALQGVAHDITERKRAEERLQQSQDDYRNLAESISDVFFAMDKDLRYTYWNKATEKLTGIPANDALGKSLYELFPEMKGTRAESLYLEAMRTGQPHAFVNEYRLKGKDMVFELNAYPSKFGLSVIAKDITERKRAEETLRESENRYRLLAENVTDVIWITDLDLRYTYVSPSVMRLRGVTAEEAIRENIEETLTLSSLQVARKALAEELSNEANPQKDPFRSRTLELEQKCKDGSTVWTEVSASFLRDPEGRPSGLLGVTRDISERKQAERQRTDLEAQLTQAQKMEAVGRLAGGIAHDFNNIVMVINGYAQLLLRKLSPRHPLRQSINEIRKAGERAASLTRQLLAFSRRQVLVPEILDLNRVVTDAEEMLRRVIGEDVELVIRQGHKLDKVLADPGQMAQVLVNLVVNARDAMPRGGRLTIETANVGLREGEVGELPGAAHGPHVMLAVSDTGVGMSKEVMEHMFEPFFTTKEPSSGTGLGLATVYGIVKQSGGYVWAQSEPGQGSTFRVYLPCAQVEAGEPAASSTKGRLIKGKETILVVEDELSVRQVIAQGLRSSGYKVLEAASGEQAMHRLRHHGDPLHLVLTDLVMPRMSGREVAESVRALYPQVKVVFISGYTDEALQGHGISGTPASFLQKPFTMEALTQKVREVLKQTPAQNT